MTKQTISLFLAACLLFSFCGCQDHHPETSTTAPETTLPAVAETAPAVYGDPNAVTYNPNYTDQASPNAIAASIGECSLTNEQLWVWYWAAVSQYRQENHDIAPDFSQPLHSQPCEVEPSINNWQQYFLAQALNTWHGAQALSLQAQATLLETEEAYVPNRKTHENAMTGMPATKFLYGYQKTYTPNTMHQAYLDSLPELLSELALEKGYPDAKVLAKAVCGSSAEALLDVSQLYNYAYSYLTFLSYDLEPVPEETGNEGETCVDFYHILLTPDPIDLLSSWDACEEKAQKLLKSWSTSRLSSQGSFSELAYRNSQDTGTAASGGAYRNIRKGQLIPPLDEWCFDSTRNPGDTAIIRSQIGFHILYFSGSTPAEQLVQKRQAVVNAQAAIIANAKEAYPIEVFYDAITLSPGEALLSYEDILYPDIAHERYPEAPLYLQQDYPNTMFGGDKISTHGCGITIMSMLTTYMTDEEWTPPEMCEAYGRYSYGGGTDGTVFINEPRELGFFFRERVFDPKLAMEALEQGLIVVSLQAKGYWTSGGHYLLLEKLTDDGMVQVRDSNIANYPKLPQHKEDKHTWGSIWTTSRGYWVFEPKLTRINACSRCGAPDEITRSLLTSDYQCQKCAKAVLRRDTFLSMQHT